VERFYNEPMSLPQRGRLPHEVPNWVSEGSFFFITVNCGTRGPNHLARADVGDAILAAAAHNHGKLAWHCRLMLLMPDHLHAIIAFPREPGMKKIMENWKHYLAAHQKIDWQRDFFDHRLRNHYEEQVKVSYILMNPVRRGFCERAEDWPWIYRPIDRPPPKLD
jgi:REP element-mobilizing transposase RayT